MRRCSTVGNLLNVEFTKVSPIELRLEGFEAKEVVGVPVDLKSRKCYEENISDATKVRWNEKCSVILIPERKEYEKAGIGREVWGPSDGSVFKEGEIVVQSFPKESQAEAIDLTKVVQNWENVFNKRMKTT